MLYQKFNDVHCILCMLIQTDIIIRNKIVVPERVLQPSLPEPHVSHSLES